MTSREAKWHRRLQAIWTTPETVIDAAVLRATGSRPLHRSRIIGSEGNEVWSLTTSTDEQVIVRISHRGIFAREYWAMQQARELGVPVPEVLLVDDAVDAGKKEVAVWIHRQITGRALSAIEPGPTLTKLTERSGELLARIHSVSTTESPFDSEATARSDDVFAWTRAASTAAQEYGVNKADLHEASSLVASYQQAIATPDRLLHGDWLPKHVLARDDRVVGVIDFGGSMGGDEAYDLAFWDFFLPPANALSTALLEGYRRGAPVDDTLFYA